MGLTGRNWFSSRLWLRAMASKIWSKIHMTSELLVGCYQVMKFCTRRGSTKVPIRLSSSMLAMADIGMHEIRQNRERLECFFGGIG